MTARRAGGAEGQLAPASCPKMPQLSVSWRSCAREQWTAPSFASMGLVKSASIELPDLMNIANLFATDHVFLNVSVSTREQLFALLAERAGELGVVNPEFCNKALHVREELGSTGLGNGIAIPHARVEGIDGVVGFLATLDRPIDFEAVDGEPVDLVMMLLMPEQAGGDQIKALSRIAKVARDEAAVNALRRAVSVDEVTDILEGLDEEL